MTPGWIAAVLLSALPASGKPGATTPPPPPRPDPIVAAARRSVGGGFAGDCSGFVRAVLARAGVRVRDVPGGQSGSHALFLAGYQAAQPRPGDLAFFHDTYDRDGDGRLGDPFTHVALVESVRGSQVTMIHRGGTGVRRLRMDLARPHDLARNDYLRVRRDDDPPGTRYLAGELFTAFRAPRPRPERAINQAKAPAKPARPRP